MSWAPQATFYPVEVERERRRFDYCIHDSMSISDAADLYAGFYAPVSGDPEFSQDVQAAAQSKEVRRQKALILRRAVEKILAQQAYTNAIRTYKVVTDNDRWVDPSASYIHIEGVIDLALDRGDAAEPLRTLSKRWYDAGAPPSPRAPPAASRGQVPEPTLTKWYRERVENWPKERVSPSLVMDVAEAQAELGRVTRVRVQAARERLAPASWKKPGPRKARPPGL